MPHRNIPIFIPHLGCPNQCVFCNQRSISGCQAFHEERVAEQIESALQTIPSAAETQIAFFGGSFTGIDRELMIRLLETAEHYIRRGAVSGIRLSTRPDYITPEILKILSRYSVQVIELGLQSMDDSVLLASRRGHTAAQAADACRAVVQAGFSLVGQMMIGLPNGTLQNEIQTAKEICTLGVSAVRIYPTVVFYGTPLCDMMQNGVYTPLTLREAVTRSAAVFGVFEEQGIPCIRLGLCASEELTSPQAVMGGPNHPALGELVRSELAYQKTLSALQRESLCGKEVVLYVPFREVSLVAGQHRENLERLERETNTHVKKIIGVEIQTILPKLWQAPLNKQ